MGPRPAGPRGRPRRAGRAASFTWPAPALSAGRSLRRPGKPTLVGNERGACSPATDRTTERGVLCALWERAPGSIDAADRRARWRSWRARDRSHPRAIESLLDPGSQAGAQSVAPAAHQAFSGSRTRTGSGRIRDGKTPWTGRPATIAPPAGSHSDLRVVSRRLRRFVSDAVAIWLALGPDDHYGETERRDEKPLSGPGEARDRRCWSGPT